MLVQRSAVSWSLLSLGVVLGLVVLQITSAADLIRRLFFQERVALDWAYQSVASQWKHFQTDTPPSQALQKSVDPAILDDIRRRIEMGDLRVKSVLLDWLAQAVGQQGDLNDPRTLIALEGVVLYEDSEALDSLRALYRQNKERDIFLPADALAVLGTREDIPALKEMLQNRALSLMTRCQAAKSLVELNEDAGRQFLLRQYDYYRHERKTKNQYIMDPVRDVLETMNDEPLIAAIQGRLSSETDSRMKNNIQTLIEQMRINGKPVDELKEMASDTDWLRSMYTRYWAIEALSQKKDTRLISFLEALQPWTGSGIPQGQNQMLHYVAADAVLRIRRQSPAESHWAQ